MAKRAMTTTSMMTVTPSTVCVNGPLARSSFTMAMAEEGDLATRMAPARMETAALAGTANSFMNGINPASMNRVRLMRIKVNTTSPDVIHTMLLARCFSSFRYSSLPAANAISPREISSTNLNFPMASMVIRLSTKGPATIPVKRNPLIRGSPNCIIVCPICREAMAMMTKPAPKITISIPYPGRVSESLETLTPFIPYRIWRMKEGIKALQGPGPETMFDLIALSRICKWG